MNQSFGNNVKLLCSHFGSISEICRRIGINRTQFNKYLSGQIVPSARNLKRICDFFGVEDHEILGPSEEFRKIIAAGGSVERAGQCDSFFRKLQIASSASVSSLHNYIGYYFEYYFSLGFPGKILKSLVQMYPHEGQLAYTRIERLVGMDVRGSSSHCKYEGRVLFLKDRITLIDMEQLTGNEVTQTVLYPAYLNKIDRLMGIKLGVSARSSREPAATRVLYQYQGVNCSFRKLFRECGLYDADSMLIDGDIRELISNDKEDRDSLFLARI